MDFLVSTSYRTTGKSTIWKLDVGSGRLDQFREDQYYEPRQRRKDFVYFGMAMAGPRLYCAGGTVLTILDLNGNLVERQEPAFLHDVHDLNLVGDELYCTNTGRDRIEVFDLDLCHQKTIDLVDLPPFRHRRLVPKSAHSPDSLHANFVSCRNDQVYITHSFTCERNGLRALGLAFYRKLWSVTGTAPATFRNRGVVVDVKGGKVLASGGVIALDGNRVIDGLYGAHDGVFFHGKFYVNATHNIETRIYDGTFKPLRTIEYREGMLIRGLYPIDNSTLLLGATRIDPKRTAASVYQPVMHARGNDEFDDFSSIKIVDVETGKIVETLRFDTFQGIHPEVHKIIPFVPPEPRGNTVSSSADLEVGS